MARKTVTRSPARPVGRAASAPSCAPQVRGPLPGPKAKAVMDRDRRFITRAYTRCYPLVIERGEGTYVWDVDGNKFLDFTAGVAVNALGHAHPGVVRAIEEQARKFIHMAGTDFYYDVMARFAEKLCTLAPGKSPKHCFLANSGTEAIEAAIKLARWSTRRPKFIAFFNAFHGRTMGSLSLTASKPIQRRGFAPLLDVAHAPYGDLEYLRKYLFGKIAPPEDVAAIFVEPVQGEGGYVPATVEFMTGLRELCDQHGILLVADEVQTGLGRTGRMWAMDHYGVVPDILCVAKPIGGGLPLGAMIARADLQTWESGAHANTFGGNPLACAAGLEVIRVLEEGLLPHVVRMGERVHQWLTRLAASHPTLRDPRGFGLLRAISVVKKNGSPDHDRRDVLVQKCFEKGLLLLGCGENGIRFLPPLNVRPEEINAAFGVLDAVVRAN